METRSNVSPLAKPFLFGESSATMDKQASLFGPLHRLEAHRTHGSGPDRSVAPLVDHDQFLHPQGSDGSYQTAMSGQLSDQCSRDLRRRRCHDDSIKGASSGQPL